MKFHKTPIALAVVAACGALPLAAQAAPTVSWNAPASGAVLSGNVSGGACAVTTSSDTSRVTFWADNWQINNDYSPPFNCDFPTSQLRDGAYTLRAVAFDASGASTEARISITVNNSGTVSTVTPTPTVSPTPTSTTSTTLALGGVATASPTPTTTTTTAVSATPTPTTTTGSTPAPLSGSLDVWFKAPLAGATVSRVLNAVSSRYANAYGSVSRVAFVLDSTALNTDSTVSDGMQCVLDTTKFANGSHQLKATAYDSSGNSRTDVISINVQNTAPNAAPTVSVTSPTAGQTVSGTAMAYAATATDDAGVSKVDFFIDSTSLGTKTSAPYGGTLDTTKLANGTHVLKAVAYDAQGLSATSQVSINVSNTVTVTPTPTPTAIARAQP